jgi:ribosome-associated protein
MKIGGFGQTLHLTLPMLKSTNCLLFTAHFSLLIFLLFTFYCSWRWLLEGIDLAHLLVDTVIDKKGENILLLDIREQTVFCDYFLFCSAENQRQLQALAEALIEKAKKEADWLSRGLEGEAESGWLLLDFGDLIVHLFSPEQRAYYNLEELWHEARVVVRVP